MRPLPNQVEIYTKFGCGYCARARQLLDKKGVAYDDYDISMGGAKRDELSERAPSARTVPQVFIGGRLIGGSDALARLEEDGQLDAMLAD